MGRVVEARELDECISRVLNEFSKYELTESEQDGVIDRMLELWEVHPDKPLHHRIGVLEASGHVWAKRLLGQRDNPPDLRKPKPTPAPKWEGDGWQSTKSYNGWVRHYKGYQLLVKQYGPSVSYQIRDAYDEVVLLSLIHI